MLDLAKYYGSNFDGFRGTTIALRPHICPFEEVLSAIPESASVFDIGCGSGFLLYAAAQSRNAQKLYGVDTNAELIEHAEQTLRTLTDVSDINLLASSNFNDWPDEQFDVVTMIDVLHHIPKPTKAEFLQAAMKRVKPGGHFIYKDMAHKPFIYAWANRMHDLILAREWISYMPMPEVISEMHAANLETSDLYKRAMWVYSHEMTIGTKLAKWESSMDLITNDQNLVEGQQLNPSLDGV